MGKIINGKELAAKIRLELKDEVEQLKANKIFPKLAVIMVGNDKASEVYVRNKSKACNEIGIEFEEYFSHYTDFGTGFVHTDIVEFPGCKVDIFH